MSQEALTRRLIKADPAPRQLGGDGVQTSLDQLGVAISAVPRPRERPRSRPQIHRPRRVLLAAIAATALLAGGAAAATSLLTAHTGQYAHGWQVKAGGPGEYLRIGASNFCQVALQVSSDIPYPPGYGSWRRWVLATEGGVKRVNPNGSCQLSALHAREEVSSGALRGTFAQSAFCAWVYDWRGAVRNGRRSGIRAAVARIDSAPHWSAVTAEDPHPTAGPLHQTRYGLNGHHSLFGWFLPFRDAVDQGNAQRVDQLITSTYGDTGCRFLVPPADSHGGTVNPVAAKS